MSSTCSGTNVQVYSARTALAGCKTLADMWSHQDTDELQRLKDQLTLLQDGGVVFPEDSWPMRLLRSHPRCASPELWLPPGLWRTHSQSRLTSSQ